MLLKPYQVRVIARACVTRYNNEEGNIITIVESYGHSKENNDLILAEIASMRPDIHMEVEEEVTE
ncbi:hypothetical protein DW1_1157 [Proteiniborus sp. DW1]|uniref:hypothetical protein n=1 Tax=Proteiniborus sp. DW1 TaxID=1889883 RepID=UPI00092E0D5A|nr:hypothetical protein [Proteiniborus sp. DW1]SCG82730.1 hypothetical protein DW1_1157 [Proteiniborus sp. DW1]